MRASKISSAVRKARRRDVVFTFSLETLADAQKREFCRPPDQALLALCRAEDRVRRVAVVNPWRSGPLEEVRRTILQRHEDVGLERTHLIRPMRLRRRDPVELESLQGSYERYDRVLERHVRRLELDSPAVLTFNPFVAAFCPLTWASNVTYYARDDWASFTPVRAWWAAYQHAYMRIRDRRTRVICVSQELASRVAREGPAVVIPNGIDGSRWNQPQPPPREFTRLKHPIVAYAGTIDSRLDVRLLASLAHEESVGSVGLIGPIQDSAVAEQLSGLPKVELLGPMSQRDLIGALMFSDVCVIPHVDSALTRAMSPLKMYEYLAAGKPVVATDLPPIRHADGRVTTAAADKFSSAVRAALAMPRQPEAARLDFVRSNSWSARHHRMLQVMLSDDADWWIY
jgi:teichuronic acid biosynthesis glycosyltransferase TuaH